MINITISDKIKKFINKRFDDLDYYSNARGKAKKEDILVGVLAELGAYEYLIGRGLNVTEPDFSYTENKNFSADLVDINTNIKYHIKGQSLSSSIRYGHSWLLQKSDRIVHNQKNISDERIICCSVDVENFTVTMLLDKEVRYYTYGECKVEGFRSTKVAIYLGDNNDT